MADPGTVPNQVQWLRNFNFSNFSRYREGQKFIFDRRKKRNTFRPLSGSAPAIYLPGIQRASRFPFRKDAEDKVNLDLIQDRDLERQSNSIKNAYNDLQRLKTYITSRFDGKLFKYGRCLGWGGCGLAAVFDVLDENGDVGRSVVVKMLFDGEREDLQNEVEALKRHKDSLHIVQLIYADGDGLMDNERGLTPEASPPNKKRKPLPTRRSLPPPLTIVLELMENGDLANFISRVRAHNERIPNRVLWHFLLCLVRMCIGLAYPTTRISDYEKEEPPYVETVPELHEPARIVHFDMDPRNIFIGRFAPGIEHSITPILALGDFGLAKEVEDFKEDSYYEVMRSTGKRGFYAPEQFCVDWDYIERDRGLVQEHPIAGNYHWHTNVWGLGMTMECLVTLCYPLIPPMPTEVAAYPPEGKMRYWTYGAHVADNDFVDRELAYLIMRCQANLPEDRPSLNMLEDFVVSKLDKEYPGETGLEVYRWMCKILHEPPPDPLAPSPSSISPQEPGDPGSTLGSGWDNPPTPSFYPQGNQVPFSGQRPQQAAAPPPRVPVPPTGIFDPGDNDAPDLGVGGFLGVGGGGGGNYGAPSPAHPVAPYPSPAPGPSQGQSRAGPATTGAHRTRRRGWTRRVHPYGRPPGTY